MSNKTKKVFATILAVLLILAMVIPLCIATIK